MPELDALHFTFKLKLLRDGDAYSATWVWPWYAGPSLDSDARRRTVET
jgi:hypothetical protein